MLVVAVMMVLVMMSVVVTVVIVVFMHMIVMVVVAMVMIMFMGQMHIELHAFYGGFVLARDVEVIAVELELFQLAFKFVRVHAQINQRANKHIAADAAKNVQI
jgi:hypothetical protein